MIIVQEDRITNPIMKNQKINLDQIYIRPEWEKKQKRLDYLRQNYENLEEIKDKYDHISIKHIKI